MVLADDEYSPAKAAIYDLFSTKMAIGCPSLMSLAPSEYKSLATYPVSYISKSTVALSVSTPQRTSPGLTKSPTYLFHFLILP